MIDSDIPIINSKLLREKIQENSIRIVDVRREQEYQQGHIRNAVNLPLAKLLADDSSESIMQHIHLFQLRYDNLCHFHNPYRNQVRLRHLEELLEVQLLF